MKEDKEGKCLLCEFKKEKDTQYGKIYQFLVKFDNGDEGYVNTKKNVPPFTPDLLEKYQIEKKSFTKDDGSSHSWNAISTIKTFFKKDDSKERIKAHAPIVVLNMLKDGVLTLTDDDLKNGIVLDDKIKKTVTFICERMLKDLSLKGRDNVFIIMSYMDLCMSVAKVLGNERSFKLYQDLISKL